ncbi:bactofilin family protein [Wenzhouxiangella sediminis]|uniref:bactofilin family protein n=1 Tax=Wenzhouxiangella sediminis TaxID=1792836 RepID=UPI001FEC0B69|nr:polymer-forming cytoskeletal protein [Wenzhouxiangella sediminis]
MDGRIEGAVHSEAEVAIGQGGSIDGELKADHIVISGSFEGNIDAKRLEIVAGGRVHGDVTVAELVIEPGALFNGNSRIRESEAVGKRKTEKPTTGAGSGGEEAAKAG